jgi:arylsulfatase A-like enzyme
MSYITRYGYEHSPQAGKVFSRPTTHESGSHRQDGLFMLSGPKVKTAGAFYQGAHLVDLAPTILHLLGCPIPVEMDGRVLSELLSTDYPVVMDHDQPGRSNLAEPAALTEAEEREMIERLKSMGYLE